MGYTTTFEGEFKLSRPLKLEDFGVLTALERDEFTDADWDRFGPGPSRGYCQWEPTKDRCGIKWNGGEKFYEYTEWLRL